jgi:uncharacterized protein (TIRG00374 family)
MARPYVYLPISVGLLLLVASRIPVDTLQGVLARGRLDLLLVAIALNAFVIALWALRSGILLRELGHRLRFTDLALLTMFANTVNNLTPASTGEIARAVILERLFGVPLPSGTAVILMERVVALYLLAATTVLAWLAFALPASVSSAAALALLMVLALVLPPIAYRIGIRPLAAAGRLLGRGAPAAGLRGRLGRGLQDVDSHLATLLTGNRTVVPFTMTTLAIFAVYAIQFALVAAAVGSPVDILSAWAVQGSALIVGIMSAIPFGLGPAEGAVAILLPTVHVPAGLAALIAIGFRLVSGLPITVLGVASYVFLSRRPRAGLQTRDRAD